MAIRNKLANSYELIGDYVSAGRVLAGIQLEQGGIQYYILHIHT